MNRNQCIEALGILKGFQPQGYTTKNRTGITGWYQSVNGPTLFRATLRLKRFKYWMLEADIIRAFANYPNHQWKFFNFYEGLIPNEIEFTIFDIKSRYYGMWRERIPVENEDAPEHTTFGNTDDVSKEVVKLRFLDNLDEKGYLTFTPTGTFIQDPSVEVNIDEIKNKPIRLF